MVPICRLRFSVYFETLTTGADSIVIKREVIRRARALSSSQLPRFGCWSTPPIRRRPAPLVPAIETRAHFQARPTLCDEQRSTLGRDVVRFADPPRLEVDVADVPIRPFRDRDSHATSRLLCIITSPRSNATVFRLARINFVRAEITDEGISVADRFTRRSKWTYIPHKRFSRSILIPNPKSPIPCPIPSPL